MSEHSYWTETRKRFEDDLKTQDITRFKTWNNSVLYVPIYNYNQLEQYYGQTVYNLINETSNGNHEWVNTWWSVLKEPMLGHIEESYDKAKRELDLNGKKYEVTPWTLKSAHHILTYIKQTGNNLSDFDQIIEFGPGIGETCRIINDLGFKGDYYLCDLPEVLEISKFYNAKYPNVKGITDYKDCPNDKKTLFIGTWSISETPIPFRDEVFEYFKDAGYLIIFADTNGPELGSDRNYPYFMLRFPQIVGRDVDLTPIPWLMGMSGGNYYLTL